MKKNETVLVGLVLGFCYLKGRTQRAKAYSRSFALIVIPNSLEANSQVNSIGFLCSYFRFADNGTLVEESQNSSYISLENYMATILAPVYEKNLLRLGDALSKRISIFLGT